jgi:hypothetical protein
LEDPEDGMTGQLFAQPSALGAPSKTFGHPYNGRYHMPLLPGESGTKSGGNWVPYGLTRMTNLVGAFEETRALSVWEQAMGLIGLALSPELYEELTLLVHQAASEGVNFEMLRDYPALKEALAGTAHDQAKQERSLIGRAKTIAKAGAAAQRGTNRHTAWEHRGKTGELIGTQAIRSATVNTEALLAEAGLVRVPGLSERVVRNLELGAVGKFDDTLMELATGRLLMADLKTKATPFYSMSTVDAQLAGYARAEWMLTEDGQGYEPGPVHHVDQEEGVILHVPSDGSRPHLDPADLVGGWENALLAKRVIERRAAGRNVARMSRSACRQES